MNTNFVAFDGLSNTAGKTGPLERQFLAPLDVDDEFHTWERGSQVDDDDKNLFIAESSVLDAFRSRQDKNFEINSDDDSKEENSDADVAALEGEIVAENAKTLKPMLSAQEIIEMEEEFKENLGIVKNKFYSIFKWANNEDKSAQLEWPNHLPRTFEGQLNTIKKSKLKGNVDYEPSTVAKGSSINHAQPNQREANNTNNTETEVSSDAVPPNISIVSNIDISKISIDNKIAKKIIPKSKKSGSETLQKSEKTKTTAVITKDTKRKDLDGQSLSLDKKDPSSIPSLTALINDLDTSSSVQSLSTNRSSFLKQFNPASKPGKNIGSFSSYVASHGSGLTRFGSKIGSSSKKNAKGTMILSNTASSSPITRRDVGLRTDDETVPSASESNAINSVDNDHVEGSTHGPDETSYSQLIDDGLVDGLAEIRIKKIKHRYFVDGLLEQTEDGTTMDRESSELSSHPKIEVPLHLIDQQQSSDEIIIDPIGLNPKPIGRFQRFNPFTLPPSPPMNNTMAVDRAHSHSEIMVPTKITPLPSHGGIHLSFDEMVNDPRIIVPLTSSRRSHGIATDSLVMTADSTDNQVTSNQNSNGVDRAHLTEIDGMYHRQLSREELDGPIHQVSVDSVPSVEPEEESFIWKNNLMIPTLRHDASGGSSVHVATIVSTVPSRKNLFQSTNMNVNIHETFDMNKLSARSDVSKQSPLNVSAVPRSLSSSASVDKMHKPTNRNFKIPEQVHMLLQDKTTRHNLQHQLSKI